MKHTFHTDYWQNSDTRNQGTVQRQIRHI